VTALAAIGNLALDRIAGAIPRAGGTVFYSARTLARLGADARVAVSCAADDAPTLEPALEGIALQVAWYLSETTNAYRFRYSPTGRRVMRLDAVGKSWSPDEAVEAVADAAWIHVGALVRTDFPRKTLAALAGGGRRLLVDGQGLVRTPVLGPLRSNGDIGDALRYVALLKLDEREAELLAGNVAPESLRALGVPEVIVTLGRRGSFVVTASGVVAAAEAARVPQPVDPTGAGDTYSAAYLVARAAGAEPDEAARSATEAVEAFLATKT
jgi:sugar/nucleoside kinase (ribokinase family)